MYCLAAFLMPAVYPYSSFASSVAPIARNSGPHRPIQVSFTRPIRRCKRLSTRPRMQNETARDTADRKEQSTSEFPETSVASNASSPSTGAPKPQYSLRTRLREETEAPFRKARMFVYGGSAISAGVGAFIATLRVIAALVGVSGTQPLSETVPNVAVNLGVIGLCALLLRFETKAGERRLDRMSRGARIGSLRIEDSATRQVLQLKDLRGRSRIVLVAGTGKKVQEAMSTAEDIKDSLAQSNLVIVPFITDSNEETQRAMRFWRMRPYSEAGWGKWYQTEREVIKARLGAKAEEVLVIIVRLDGKVGARSVGSPMWLKLIEEIKRLPKRDQYGKP